MPSKRSARSGVTVPFDPFIRPARGPPSANASTTSRLTSLMPLQHLPGGWRLFHDPQQPLSEIAAIGFSGVWLANEVFAEETLVLWRPSMGISPTSRSR